MWGSSSVEEHVSKIDFEQIRVPRFTITRRGVWHSGRRPGGQFVCEIETSRTKRA